MASEESIIQRVTKLLERAAHVATPPEEADSCIAMADKMMEKYSIDQAMLQASRSKEEREVPERRDEELFGYGQLSEHLGSISDALSGLCDVIVVRIADDKHAIIGFNSDIDYFLMLFNTVRIQFQAKMYPRWDNSLTLDHNIYNFKIAGYRWIDIWREGATRNDKPMPCVSPPKDGGYMIRAYKRHAALIGDTRHIKTQRFDAYRASYASGFVNTVIDRVASQTQSREQAASAGGAALAVRDRRTDVREAFYAEFPGSRPLTAEQMAAWRAAAQARRAAEEEAERVRRAGLTDKQREMEDRKQERINAANERYWANYDRRHARDADGYSAGRRAAASLDLSGGRNNLGRTREIQ